MPSNRVTSVLSASLLFVFTSLTASAAPTGAPASLEEWTPWILEKHPEYHCPFQGNLPTRVCDAPSRLTLDLGDQKGTFSLEGESYREGWISLPGHTGAWPQSVTLNGTALAVGEHNDGPSLYLPAGAYRIQGAFVWQHLPEQLNVPAAVALIDLRVNGQSYATVHRPRQDSIWVGSDPDAMQPDQGDRLSLNVFREISDDVPSVVNTLYRLEVAGTQREVSLPLPLLPGFEPLRVQSALPVRLDSAGQFLVQVRPGRWDLYISGRSQQAIAALTAPGYPDSAVWPDSEVWVYRAQPAIRLTELSGVPTIDPTQVALPPAWQGLPSYRLHAGDTLTFTEKRRGDPDPEGNQLTLARTLWLDFDGKGYTASDQINGTLSQGWRLETEPGTELGYLEANGQPQLITRLHETAAPGVEIRQGKISLTGESRLARSYTLPATGWNETFQSVTFELHTPPGWGIFSVSGTDNVPQTWMQRWTLFDVFLVLVVAVGAARLWGWHWGGIVLLGLIVLWHEPAAPRWAWVNLLLAAALLRVVSSLPRLQTLIQSYRAISALVLVMMLIPFAVNQLRIAIYPQLEHPDQPIQSESVPYRMYAPQEIMLDQAAAPEMAAELQTLSSEAKRSPRNAYAGVLGDSGRALSLVDPNARLNTGPGLPRWQWNTLQLSWSGPVQPDQTVHIRYIPPLLNSLLNIISVLFGVLLAWRFTCEVLKANWKSSLRAALPGLLALCLLPLLAISNPRETLADYPPEPLLNELEARLMAPPDCLPGCASIANGILSAEQDQLQLRLEIQAIERIAVPLPGQAGQWLPQLVMVNETLPPLYRDHSGGLYLVLDAGVHRLTLAGTLAGMNSTLLHFPLTPKHLTHKLDGWDVKGYREPGIPGAQLELVRVKPDGGADKQWQAVSLPPFVSLNRSFDLGLEWRVSNEIIRMAPAEGSIALSIPLLPGESVLSDRVSVDGDHALVTLGPDQVSFQWESRLDITDQLALAAANASNRVETWHIAVSPIWRVKYSGLAPIHHADRQARWLPVWQPWPGEQLLIDISRPAGIEGPTETIQASALNVQPGQRATDAALSLSIRSSQGSQYSLTLPEAAELQTVTIDGSAQPVRQEGRRVTLPLKPGLQSIALSWRTPVAVRVQTETPTVDLGIPYVNAAVSMQMGYDRWILWLSGPDMGPAIQFWGVLLVIILIAVALGRSRRTPLNSWQWVLLGLGLSQVPLALAAVVVAWFFVLAHRGSSTHSPVNWKFNLYQVAIAVLTLVAISSLFMAVQTGLLGWPAMMVTGNQSSAYLFNWYQDRATSGVYPKALVISVPVLVYRVLMLLWALWLAFASIRWLKWGWTQYARGGLYRQREPKAATSAKTAAADTADDQ
jgi:hypothetical protein